MAKFSVSPADLKGLLKDARETIILSTIPVDARREFNELVTAALRDFEKAERSPTADPIIAYVDIAAPMGIFLREQFDEEIFQAVRKKISESKEVLEAKDYETLSDIIAVDLSEGERDMTNLLAAAANLFTFHYLVGKISAQEIELDRSKNGRGNPPL